MRRESKNATNRPDGPGGFRAFGIAIHDGKLVLVAHGLAHDAKIDGFSRRPRSSPHVKGIVVDLVLQFRREHGPDFCECVTCGQCEFFVSLAGYPLGTERQSLDFLLGEHQGRKEKAGLQDITEAGLALDLCAERLQVGDVAINRAQRHARLGSKILGRHRMAVPPQDLHEVE